MKTTALASLALSVGFITPLFAGLEIKDTEGKHLDVVSGDKVLVRYMYEHDTSSKEKQHETYKPYLHVFDAEGKKPITKGPGGQYTHHRGIFIGWNRITFNGKNYDRWHMNNGDIVHQEFLQKQAGGRDALIVSKTHWQDEKEQPMLDEERSMAINAPEGESVRLVIDFRSKLTASYGDISLKGDPEHAGVQYRPANEVDPKRTKYVFPKEGINVKEERDLPWIAETYVLDGKTYSVVQMNHPDNPKDTRHSAYRDYGRFGSFFETGIKKGESLTVNYRFVITDGELPERDVMQKAWEEYTARK